MIRAEKPGDIDEVRELNLAAFPTPAEARLVDTLRSEVQGCISLVYLSDSKITGHIFFSPVKIATNPDKIPVCGLAPMAVLPEFQKLGIGSKLVEAGFEAAKEKDYRAIVVLGHAAYYPRFGFEPATNFGLECEFDVPKEIFMALELKPGALSSTSGTVQYHPLFHKV